MIDAGMDVARIGVAHGTLEQNLERFHLRPAAAAADADRPVGILVDLPGPKVRAGLFPDEGVVLADGADVRIEPGTGRSTAEVVEVDYERIALDVEVGDQLVFGDGVGRSSRVAEQVAATASSRRVAARRPPPGSPRRARPVRPPAHCRRRPPRTCACSTPSSTSASTWWPLSFVRSAHDVRKVGTEPHPRGPLVVAKIETRAAVDNLEGIIEASGAVMVARGDLGAECAIEELPHLQKRIIRTCIALGRPVITATQMLESMVSSPTPTRAEASDIANAIFDGSSALMLSGETRHRARPGAGGGHHGPHRRAGRRASSTTTGWAHGLTQIRARRPAERRRRRSPTP